MEKRVKTVFAPFGVGKKIASAFGTTTKSVSEALHGKSDSEMARKIRYVAIKEYGGIALTYYDDFVANCDTVRDSKGDMESIYTDRVKIVYNEAQHMAGVYIDGELKEKCPVKSIAEYMEFEKRVQGVVANLM